MLFHNYKQRVLSVGRGDLIGYWPMDEHAGAVAIDASPEGNNGAYTAVTLNNVICPDGRGCPRFNGAASYNNIYSAGFNADFDGNSGSAFIWGKVFNVGIWTNGLNGRLIHIRADTNNRVFITKAIANNTVIIQRIGGAVSESYSIPTTTTDWFSVGVTWDTVADEVKYYFNGALVATSTTLGNWVGALNSTLCCIGSLSVPANQVFNGWLAHGAVWKTARSENEMGILGKI